MLAQHHMLETLYQGTTFIQIINYLIFIESEEVSLPHCSPTPHSDPPFTLYPKYPHH